MKGRQGINILVSGTQLSDLMCKIFRVVPRKVRWSCEKQNSAMVLLKEEGNSSDYTQGRAPTINQ